MKKILLTMCIILCSFSFTACSGEQDIVVPYKTVQKVKQEEAAKKIDEYNKKLKIENYKVMNKVEIYKFEKNAAKVNGEYYYTDETNINIIKKATMEKGIFIDLIILEDQIIDFMFYDSDGNIIGNTEYSIKAYKDIPEPGSYEGEFIIASVSRELVNGKIGNQEYRYYALQATDIKGRTIYFEYRIYSNTKISTIYDMNKVSIGDTFKLKYDVRSGKTYGTNKSDVDYVITSFEKIDK